MQKRGQVTIFIILGIIIVAAVFLFMALKDKVLIGVDTEQSLVENVMPQITTHIETCIDDRATALIYKLAKQGGYLDITDRQGTFKYYEGEPISYLCYDIPNQPQCRSRGLYLSDIETQLTAYLKEDLVSCIDLDSYDGWNYDVSYGDLSVQVDVGDDKTVVAVDLPVTVKKGDLVVEENSFFKTINLPLGRIFGAASDIVGYESSVGDVDAIAYSTLKTDATYIPYIVWKNDQPYPDKLYYAKINDVPSSNKELLFRFFVQGEARESL